MNALRVGVIGVGHLGKEHARIYSGIQGAQLVGVVDADEAQARSIARKYKTEWSTDPAFLLERAEAVSVAVPTAYHHGVALPFLKRGIAVLVEKPMTFSVAEAEDLVDAAARSGATLQVGHVERFNPGFRAIAQHGLRPLFLECHRLSPFRFRSGDIGVVFDLMIHDLDIIQCLVGSEISRIEAVGVPVISTHEDIANARLVFENSCVANLTASRVSLKTLRRIRFFAPDCYVSIDTHEQKATIYRKKSGFEEVAEKLRAASDARLLLEMRKLVYGDLVEVESVKLDEREPLRSELESFVVSARERRPAEVPGEDGLKAIRVAASVVEEIKKNLSKAGINLPPIGCG